jgi:hypothetical protein
MCPDVIIIGGICSKDPAKVLFAQDHDVVQAFSPD